MKFDVIFDSSPKMTSQQKNENWYKFWMWFWLEVSLKVILFEGVLVENIKLHAFL